MKYLARKKAVVLVLSATNNPLSDELASQASTAAYYELNAAEYVSRTINADISELYQPFLSLLPDGSKILDVGCGAGRDLKEFKSRGFRPYGIDSSPALVQYAHLNSGAPVEPLRVEDATFQHEFEGIWACASLLHLPKRQFFPVLIVLKRALKNQGVIFISVQEGSGETTMDDGRFFAFYNLSELSEKVSASGLHIQNSWRTMDKLPGRSDVHWINILARKSPD